MTTLSAHVTLDDALHFARAGLAVLRVRADGSKAPLGLWKQYQMTPATEEIVRVWFAQGSDGIGAVMGRASGNCELLDFDDGDIHHAFQEAACAAGLGELVERIERSYSELTPSGVHLVYRCPEIEGNTKLAQRLAPAPDKPHGVKTLIESRGEGGYAVMAPSGGKTHPTGRSYTVLLGSLQTIAIITPEERRDLWTLARSFDEMPVKEERLGRPNGPTFKVDDGVSPGEEFNARVSWVDILHPHGWARIYRQGQTDYWRRPGKDRGVSATTNHTGRDTLINFSTSTPFETAPNSYTKFGAYTVLNHGGDFRAAANALRLRGYGWH